MCIRCDGGRMGFFFVFITRHWSPWEEDLELGFQALGKDSASPNRDLFQFIQPITVQSVCPGLCAAVCCTCIPISLHVPDQSD